MNYTRNIERKAGLGALILIRKHFPEVFARRADQSRRFGSRLARIKGERVFLDEIPADWPTNVKGANFGGCGFHCNTEPAS